jgi:hypothetical protein
MVMFKLVMMIPFLHVRLNHILRMMYLMIRTLISRVLALIRRRQVIDRSLIASRTLRISLVVRRLAKSQIALSQLLMISLGKFLNTMRRF